MRKRNYRLWNRETGTVTKIRPKDMTRLFPRSQLPFNAAHLEMGKCIEWEHNRLTCIQ